MEPVFFQTIYNHPLLKAEDYKEISKAHTPFEFSEGALLLEKGKIAKAFYIIEDGLLRSFLYDYKGDEITTEFYCPNEILIESFSLFHSLGFIALIEDTEGNMVGLRSAE